MQVIAFVLLQFRIVPQQLVQAAAKGKQHQGVDKEEFDDVDNHAAKWHLQRSQVRIYREYVHQLQIGEDHARSKGALGEQHGVEGMPMLAGKVRINASKPQITLKAIRNCKSLISNF